MVPERTNNQDLYIQTRKVPNESARRHHVCKPREVGTGHLVGSRSDDGLPRRKIDAFLESEPVTKTLEFRLLGKLGELVSTLPRMRTVAEAITTPVALLQEAGMVAGRFEPEDLFALGFDTIKTTLKKAPQASGGPLWNTPRQIRLIRLTSRS